MPPIPERGELAACRRDSNGACPGRAVARAPLARPEAEASWERFRVFPTLSLDDPGGLTPPWVRFLFVCPIDGRPSDWTPLTEGHPTGRLATSTTRNQLYPSPCDPTSFRERPQHGTPCDEGTCGDGTPPRREALAPAAPRGSPQFGPRSPPLPMVALVSDANRLARSRPRESGVPGPVRLIRAKPPARPSLHLRGLPAEIPAATTIARGRPMQQALGVVIAIRTHFPSHAPRNRRVALDPR